MATDVPAPPPAPQPPPPDVGEPDEPAVPPGVDASVPSPARMYDFFLGGSHNYASDREIGRHVKANIGEVADAAWANRSFHQRAARWLAECGIRQFVDVGSGLPTAGNTHDIVHHAAPSARVVYVDSDPLVRLYSQDILAGDARCAVVQADLRDVGSVLENPDLRALIDFSQPVGLLMTAVMHFVAPSADPWALVARYVDALVPGSYLALSHATDDKTPPQLVQVAEELYSRASENIYFRSQADIERFFAGLTMVSPCPLQQGVVHVGEWGTDDAELADSDGSRWLYCGVGRLDGAREEA